MILPLKNSALAFAIAIICACSVQAAKCTNPAQRKEWRTLSTVEKTDWLDAVKCLNKLPHDPALAPLVNRSISNIVPVNASGTYYDDFVYMHMDLNTRIHFTGLFFPWHRWYVHVYEQALKSRCGFKGTSPYWEWDADSADVYGSTMFQDSDPRSGLGGWGDPARDFSVPDGALSDFELSYPSHHILRRNFTLQPLLGIDFPFFPNTEEYANSTFKPSDVARVVNGYVGDFMSFQKDVEAFQPGMHGSVHLILGGDLAGQCPINAPADCAPAPTYSPNEPIFWMHHGMIDKIWYEWQHKNSQNKMAFYGGSVQNLTSVASYEQYPNGAPPYLNLNSTMPADGLFSEATIGDMMDTTGGVLCYVYV